MLIKKCNAFTESITAFKFIEDSKNLDQFRIFINNYLGSKHWIYDSTGKIRQKDGYGIALYNSTISFNWHPVIVTIRCDGIGIVIDENLEELYRIMNPIYHVAIRNTFADKIPELHFNKPYVGIVFNNSNDLIDCFLATTIREILILSKNGYAIG